VFGIPTVHFDDETQDYMQFENAQDAAEQRTKDLWNVFTKKPSHTLEE